MFVSFMSFLIIDSDDRLEYPFIYKRDVCPHIVFKSRVHYSRFFSAFIGTQKYL